MLPHTPLTETFGRYQLLMLLARGGMAEVHLARMTGAGGFGKQLAIKRIIPWLADEAEFVDMFVNEGRIAARLNHPNVCQVYEFGEVDGHLFLAMEYLEGLSWKDLARLLPRNGHFELRCAAAVLGQVCNGLRHAHELHDVNGMPTPVIHRDVSPNNMMITVHGLCKLFDFGVSKVLTEGSRTRAGMVKGKLPYMSPEQIRGELVDQRADVFSLGTVLWEALAGEPLFLRDSDYQIWRAVTEADIPTISSLQPTLPREIDAVIGRALERDVDKRYSTVAAFASDLRRVADQVGGPLDQAALADLVISLGAARLATRAQQVGRALDRSVTYSYRSPSAALPAAVPHSAAVSVTNSSVRRSGPRPGEPAPMGDRGHRHRWIALGVLLITGGIVVAAHQLSGGIVSAEPDDTLFTTSGVEPREPREPRVTSDASTAGAGAAGPADTTDGTAPTTPGGALAKLDAPVIPESHMKRPAGHDLSNKNPTDAQTGAQTAALGQHSVDSKPYATIYVDGKSYGETPLFKIELPPGRHRVRAVRADGHVQRREVLIKPGKLATSGTLWLLTFDSPQPP